MDDGHKWQQISVRRGIAPEQRAAVAALLWRGYGRGLMPFSRRVAAEAWIARALNPNAALLAMRGAAVVGVVGLRDRQGGLLRVEAGWRMALWRPGPATTELVIDGLAVAPDQQRRGIGLALIEAVLAEARWRGHRGARAEVAAGNIAALRLFTSAGFVETGRVRAGPLWRRPAHLLRRGL